MPTAPTDNEDHPATAIASEDLRRLKYAERTQILSIYLEREIAERFEAELARQRDRNPRVSKNSLARHAIRIMLDCAESERGSADAIVADAQRVHAASRRDGK